MKVPLTTNDFLNRASGVYGSRIGIVDEETAPGSLGKLTYQEVAQLARAQAAALDALGIEAGGRVAILSKNSARLLISFFGVSGFGRVLAPINFRLKRDEIAYIVEHCGASLLLVDPELAQAVSDIDCPQLILDEAGDQKLFRKDAEPIEWTPNEDAIATVNYTSGTTARPKGVCLTHRNVWLNATVFGLHSGVSDRDVYLHTVPMFHCNGWGMPYILAGLGAKQIVQRNVDGREILRRVDRHGVTLLCGAPTVASMILDAASSWDGPVPGRDRTRMVIAGAPPPTKLIERIETELGWEFLQIYGLTETAPLLTINRPRDEDDALSPTDRARRLTRAGVPVLGVSMKTADDGEVLARGNSVLDHYCDDPAATAEAIRDDWFYTGDGGHIDDEGFLTISDRKKDVIITGGENVSSIEVEDVLFSHPVVAEVAVIGVPHEKWGETVVALVVLNPDEVATEADLIDFAREQLAHFKCPTSIEFTSSLPRTATGKLKKFELRAAWNQ